MGKNWTRKTARHILQTTPAKKAVMQELKQLSGKSISTLYDIAADRLISDIYRNPSEKRNPDAYDKLILKIQNSDNGNS